MNLTLPDPTVTPGPTWATELNAAVTTVDSHDHTPGKGVKVPTDGININSDLSLNSHSAVSVKTTSYDNQPSTLAASVVSSTYVVGGDLYYNNGSGQPVQVTNGSSVLANPILPDNVTIKIISNEYVAQPNQIALHKEHAWELNGNYGALTAPLLNLDSIFIAPVDVVITSVWIYNGTAGSSGTTEFDLKVASSGGAFTSILSTTGQITSSAASGVWTDDGSVIAAQTGVTKPVLSVTSISAGQAVRFDMLQRMFGAAADARIRIFYRLA